MFSWMRHYNKENYKLSPKLTYILKTTLIIQIIIFHENWQINKKFWKRAWITQVILNMRQSLPYISNVFLKIIEFKAMWY